MVEENGGTIKMVEENGRTIKMVEEKHYICVLDMHNIFYNTPPWMSIDDVHR